MRAIPLFFALLGCPSAPKAIVGNGSVTSSLPTDADSDADSDADPDWAGMYPGTVTVTSDFIGDLCSGEMTVYVDADGIFSGDGLCESLAGDTEVTVSGEFDEDLNAEGEVYLSSPLGESELSLSGDLTDGKIYFEWRIDSLAATATFESD